MLKNKRPTSIQYSVSIFVSYIVASCQLEKLFCFVQVF